MNNRPYPSAEARQAVLGHIIEVVKTRLPQEIRAMLLCFTRDLRLFVLPAGDMMSPDLKPRFVRTVQELVKEHDIAIEDDGTGPTINAYPELIDVRGFTITSDTPAATLHLKYDHITFSRAFARYWREGWDAAHHAAQAQYPDHEASA